MHTPEPMRQAEPCARISLAGWWGLALDRQNVGIRERWFARRLEEPIALPGTTDEAQKGDFVDERCEDRLSRVWRWIGPAWYQRTVTIPRRWKGRRITLFLERTKDSQVWVDERWMGSDDSLSTPHVFDLSEALTPGPHTITVLVDNAKLPPVGPCHQVDERTQTNWNGILGRIELIATDPVWVDDVQVEPDPEKRSARVSVALGNRTRWRGRVNLTLRVEAAGRASGAFSIPSRRVAVLLDGPRATVDCEVPLPDGVPLWDEFQPALLRLTVTSRARARGALFRDRHRVVFGLRRFAAVRGQFAINGRPTFLRGKLDCALFPLTGYAPMDKAEWLRLLKIARDYGINHYRFHSWCPPEAAFAAADELGMYFQVELPNKRGLTEPSHRDYKPPAQAYETLDELVGPDAPPAVRTAYLTREGERILRAFGNHPSFVMLTLGNELGGDEAVMKAMCDHFRALDRRHLYAMGTGHFHWDVRYRQGDEFWVTRATAPGLYVRGASWDAECHIDHQPPSTTVDYRAALQGVPVPVVSHEMAQFEVYPDYSEIEKYTGVLRARNLEIFRERLRAAGMLDQAVDFLKASGALSVLCHREDVEAALRTPGFGGFHMLDLQDFSGQGTALVGILNVFMESKGLITPQAWREFCCETVPLLWMTKYTWTNDEVFRGRIRVAHYGPRDFRRQAVVWQVRAGDQILAEGRTRAADIPTGTVTDVDLLCAHLSPLKKPRRIEVVLKIPGTPYRNRYNAWVYPAGVRPAPPGGIVTARRFDAAVQKHLAQGGRALLLPRPDRIRKSVAMAFQTGFWSPMFRNKPGPLNPLGKETPGTQGILCNPRHPLFRDFPTEFHGNWQWWRLVKHSRAMIFDAFPPSFRPLVQVIDGFDRNHKLGLIAEVRVGRGRLLICSSDLPALQDFPEARQLLFCLYRYLAGRGAEPVQPAEPKEIGDLL